MSTPGQKPPRNVCSVLEAARTERGEVGSREVKRDPELFTEVDLLFALEELLERASKALHEAERAEMAAAMAVSHAPDDAQVAALRSHARTSVTASRQWVADTADAVVLSTQRLAARRQAARSKPRCS